MQALDILRTAVELTVGPGVQPRPGQILFTEDAAATLEGRKYLSGIGPTGLGKALDVDTPIPTPAGWTRMGDLVTGDTVFSETGAQIQVLGAYDVQLDRPCYEVEFSDGSVIVADEEHLWSTSTRARRALETERTRPRKGEGAKLRFENTDQMQALLDDLESGVVQRENTLASAMELLNGLVSIETLIRHRAALSDHRLAANETFDLAPVLGSLISAKETRTRFGPRTGDLYQVVSTAEIRDSLVGQGEARNHAVFSGGQIDTSVAELPLDPYLLGAWLGDGTSIRCHITSDDPEIIQNIVDRGYFAHKLTQRLLYSIHMTDNAAVSSTQDNMTRHIRALNLYHNKHIPAVYLRASIEQRMELLRGIMDTDGTVGTNGRCEIVFVNERLTRDTLELVRSLGMVAKFTFGDAAITEPDPDNPGQTRRRKCGTRYRVGFTTALPVSALKRKAERLPTTTRETTRLRYIVDVHPVASRPVRCIAVSSPSRLFLAGPGMVPTHNTFSLLSAAAWRAAMFQERSIVSTESLSLQEQVISKDAPVIVRAVLALDGPELTVAVLKGVNNYVDPRKLLGIAHFIAKDDHEHNLKKLMALVAGTRLSAGQLEVLDGADGDTLKALVVWGLGQYDDDRTYGDRHSYDAAHTEAEWSFISASSADAAGIDDTPYIPKAVLARERASVADIVVTNHTMLAIQAATGIPIVIGNKNLGVFDHIIVDEAHALPDQVRNQGASEVSGRSVFGVVRAVQKVADEGAPRTRKWVDDGEAYAELLETHFRSQLGREGTLRLDKEADPLGDIGYSVKEWAKRGGKLAEHAAKSPDITTMVKGRRAQARAAELSDAIDSVSTHRSGEARWVEKAPEQRDSKFKAWSSAQSSPVDVSGKIMHNLWVRKVEGGEEDEVEPLGVIVASATLPQGFPFQVGMNTTTKEYESPFAQAYGNSILFIPSAQAPEDVAALGKLMYGKTKFDTQAHRPWAQRLITDLVLGNEGSALVLSASAENGKQYAKALRVQAEGFDVHSQWDGETPARLLNTWRNDVGSVLVGTRSMMTGVDAPGETCTLVILDRIPRRPGNPIDDARVEMLTDKLGDKWVADRLTYAADAALLEEQAIGRLIRSMSDTGMVAVLDPRLLALTGNRRGPFTYPEQTRQIYMKPLYKFPVRTASKAHALEWLRNRRANL